MSPVGAGNVTAGGVNTLRFGLVSGRSWPSTTAPSCLVMVPVVVTEP